MNFKTILLMIITLFSVFLTIYLSTIYTTFVVPYLIGFFTPILVNNILNTDFQKIKKPTRREK